MSAAATITQIGASLGLTERYELQDEQGKTLPTDASDYAIVIDRVAGLAIDVRAIHTGDHASCEKFAAESTLAGRKWTLPSVTEIVAHISDRTRTDPALAEPFATKLADAHWRLWTREPYADDDAARPVYPWFVGSNDGGANVSYRYLVGLALPVSPLASSSGQ